MASRCGWSSTQPRSGGRAEVLTADRAATVPERPVAAAWPGMKHQSQSQTNGPADTLRLVFDTAAVRDCDVERSNDSEMHRLPTGPMLRQWQARSALRVERFVGTFCS
jgi:hypothetical protein